MKRSLDHLPASKQEQLDAIVRIIRDAVDVEMIILFGSHARGDWVDDPVGGYFSEVLPEIVWVNIEEKAQQTQ